jgi:hypothetical protein
VWIRVWIGRLRTEEKRVLPPFRQLMGSEITFFNFQAEKLMACAFSLSEKTYFIDKSSIHIPFSFSSVKNFSRAKAYKAFSTSELSKKCLDHPFHLFDFLSTSYPQQIPKNVGQRFIHVPLDNPSIIYYSSAHNIPIQFER